MYTIEKIKLKIANKINKSFGKELVFVSSFVYPPKSDMGDLSLPLFEIAKKIKKNPNQIGEILVKEFKSFDFGLSSVLIVGPYLNFKFNKKKLATNVINEIKKEKYGENKSNKNKKVMIEFTNANTHKEYHVGHLRNLCYGDSVSKIIKANGAKAIPVSYINDFGIHVAKTLWAYLEFYKDEKLPQNKGYFLGKIYVRAATELKKNEDKNQFVRFIMKKIESRQGEEYDLWEKTRQWSIEQFEKIYNEMGVKLLNIFYESEFIDKGRELVPDLIKKGILKKSQGALIADLEKYGLGVLVFLRSDGTATYPVADLPLAIMKIKKYKLDKSIYVVDNRQSLYFKQLFKVLGLMGYKEEMVHLGYEVVKLPSGMMSSRSGNVITYEELKKDMVKACISETKNKHKDWSEKKIANVAEKIAKGAIRFEMIKVNAKSIITFDIKKALLFSGFTSVYLQYTLARIKSIKRKYNKNYVKKKEKIEYPEEIKNSEHDIVLKLGKYPEIVFKSGETYDPSEIAKYLFELAQVFNDYYHKTPILKSERKELLFRMDLIFSVEKVMESGLNLLGIDVLEEM
jgi:arginyl-tRNA synthetase